MGKLYLVATPIGNLGDLSDRAREVLSSVDIVFAEDTRVSGKLMSRFGINKPLETYNQHSFERKRDRILKILIDGGNVALVTDAGTPGVSDPGNELLDFLYKAPLGTSVLRSFEGPVGAASRSAADVPTSQIPNLNQIKVVPVPGVSAVTAALSVCGFDTQRYLFGGFFPKKKKGRIGDWLGYSVALIFFESPHRIIKTLEWIGREVGSTRRVFVAREMTKLYETFYRGSISEVIEQLKNEKSLKGEIVFVVEKK